MSSDLTTVPPQTRKLCYEPVFESFNEVGKKLLEETPEAHSLVMLVDWAVGNNDFPAICILTKDLSEKSILSLMQQTIKLMNSLSTSLKTHMEEQIKKLQETNQPSS